MSLERKTHDDAMHQGSAKRDQLNGVVGLDSGGGVLGIGRYLLLGRGSLDEIQIRDRNSTETIFEMVRAGANDWNGTLLSGGSLQSIQLANMKDAANGIAGLDASLKQVPAQHFVSVPASAAATGTVGQMAYDATYFYICTATDTWKRVGIAGW